MNECFYVKINGECDDFYWYSDYTEEVFLVMEDTLNSKAYVLVSRGAWIMKEHCYKVNIDSWLVDEDE